MTEPQNTDQNTEKTWTQVEPAPTEVPAPDPAAPTEAQPVDVPRHEHDDYDESPDAQESAADFDAEEQNPKETTA